MRTRTFLLIAALAAAVAGSAVAAPLAADPASMLVPKSAFPKSAKYTRSQVPSNVIEALKKGFGVDARGALFSASIPVSSTKSELVSGTVYTTANPGQAKKLYAALKTDLGGGSKLPLKKYGDEQTALYKTGTSIANIAVRRNRVVWQLSVQGMGLLVIPKPQIRAEIKKYAAQQKVRVGPG